MARKELLFFCRYVHRGFQTPHHIELIAQKLEAVERGEIKRLIINMPPRHGKSMLCSQFFPAWFMGRNPEKKLILASYGAQLAVDFTGFTRNLMRGQEYGEVFETRLSEDSKAKNRFNTNQGGHLMGAGVGGAITGKGAHVAIVDDPVKSWEEAKSELVQDNIWEWYRSTFLTRLEPEGAIVLIMTRWVENDLAGRLLETEGEDWETLVLPALKDGLPLWPERFDEAALDKIRHTLGEAMFQALYQQGPIDVIERIFKNPIMGEPPPAISLHARLDPAFGGSDYNALTIGGRDLGRQVEMFDNQNGQPITVPPLHIVHGSIWQGQIDETYDKLVDILRAFDVNSVFVEANQAQVLIVNSLRKRGIIAIPKTATKNKHFRIVNWAKQYWPALRFSRAVEDDYMRQVLKYSESAKNDDAPDSLAGLVEDLYGSSRPQKLQWT